MNKIKKTVSGKTSSGATHVVLIAVMMAVGLICSVAWSRIWTDTKGRKVEAELVRVEEGKAFLKTKSGKVVGLPLKLLSEGDRGYIASLEEKKSAEKKTGDDKVAAESAPPEGQEYMGVKACAACHFKQFLVWKSTNHAKSFEKLTAKYRTDTECLKCHTTGHGEPTGFKSVKATPNLVGTSCEACHGPGSKHGAIAKGFGTKKLSAADEKLVRGAIYKIRPDNACIVCHSAKAHKTHPKYDKK